MCAAIGVDPLVGASARKRDQWGWGVLGIGDFWLGVATRVVGLCRRTRGENGGFIAIAEVSRVLNKEDKGGKGTQISEYACAVWC
jgi:ESCRT-II complex subunit VPS22